MEATSFCRDYFFVPAEEGLDPGSLERVSNQLKSGLQRTHPIRNVALKFFSNIVRFYLHLKGSAPQDNFISMESKPLAQAITWGSKQVGRTGNLRKTLQAPPTGDVGNSGGQDVPRVPKPNANSSKRSNMLNNHLKIMGDHTLTYEEVLALLNTVGFKKKSVFDS
jgi:hypothetical protein